MSMQRHAVLSLIVVGAFYGRASRAEPVRIIDAPLILVTDVANLARTVSGGSLRENENENGKAASETGVELGPAPPPGGSRLVERREVEARLRESGISVETLTMPAVVRVVRAARRLTPAELVTETEPSLRAALPEGVTLVNLHFARGAVVSPHATVRQAVLPRLPHRSGPVKTTVMFELVEGGEVSARVAGTVTLDVSERAAQSAVLRGARLDLVIEKGPAKVTAVGFALRDADVGEVISVRVDGTQKILEARVTSGQSAKVVRQ